MNLEKLLATYQELLEHMENDGYSVEYIKRVEWEVKWLRRTRGKYHFDSYEEMFRTRLKTGSKPQCSVSREGHLRTLYAILQRFEEDGVFRDRRKGRPFLPRGSYFKLLPEFREVVDLYKNCYEMTFFKGKSQRNFTCQIVQNTKRHLKRAETVQISGIGHSVIRGLDTTGQWFSASTTVYSRGSPQGRRHSFVVDC